MIFNASYELPDNVADVLRQNWNSISRTNLEDIAVISYKTGILTSFQVQLMLGHESRWETEDFLHKHRCHLSYDERDFQRDGEVLKEILDKKDIA
ncbi:MAG: UPF0175 family protein [Candidatus Thiosymbion ectosymbiont of Robbea hypermnestra]|nr:UPF0175 family protein [Candidatus Thiosymbion ectosymbiont of Robbea hypermnestra]